MTKLNTILQWILNNFIIHTFGDGKYIKFGKLAIYWIHAQPQFGTGTAWCGGYYHLCTSGIDFPTGLFIETPYVFYTKSDGVLSSIVGQSITKDACSPILFNADPNIPSGRLLVDVLAIGLWK